MANDPNGLKNEHWFKFYYLRILVSCSGWSDEEFGAYIKLLIHQFDKGFVPEDDKELRRIITSYKKNWQLLKSKFTESEPGKFVNNTMSIVRDEFDEKRKRGREVGINGGRPISVKIGQTRFYLIRCIKGSEIFFKAGTTGETIKGRFGSSGNGRGLPYKFDILIDSIVEFQAGVETEKEIRVKCRGHIPLIKFGGHTECYEATEKNFFLIKEILENKNPLGYKNNQSGFEIVRDNISTSDSISQFEKVGTGEKTFTDDEMDIDLLLQKVLLDTDYRMSCEGAGYPPGKLEKWMEAFNRFLKFKGNHRCREDLWRLGFPGWMNYHDYRNGENPDDYNPVVWSRMKKENYDKIFKNGTDIKNAGKVVNRKDIGAHQLLEKVRRESHA